MVKIKQNCNNSNHAKLLGDYKIKINEHDANVLECQTNFVESSLMFERRIFFNLSGQLYEISFYIGESERNNEFEKGYEYFLNSIKILP